MTSMHTQLLLDKKRAHDLTLDMFEMGLRNRLFELGQACHEAPTHTLQVFLGEMGKQWFVSSIESDRFQS